MLLRFRLLSLAALVVLPACAKHFHPVVVAAAPTKIVYRISPERIEGARLAAASHCKQHQRRALFEQVTDAGGPTMIASFRCK
jgi:hypothetical protein